MWATLLAAITTGDSINIQVVNKSAASAVNAVGKW